MTRERDGGDLRSANVRRLQPLRVLLSGPDRRFVRVTSFLLSRRGYEVAEARLGEIVDAAARHRSDVVVLEPSKSRVVAGRAIAGLQASAAPPGLVLVCDEGETGRWNGLTTVHKWSPIEDLIEEIETAASRRLPPAVVAPPAEQQSGSL